MDPHGRSRRVLLRGAGSLAAAGAVGLGGYRAYRLVRPPVDPHTVIPLYSRTVAFAATGRRVLVGAGEAGPQLRTGTRLTTDVALEDESAESGSRFREATAPWRDQVPEEFGDLADSALADLWVLSQDLPAPVAAWTPSWRYVWPRDAAFCAVALARIGHRSRALSVLEHLASIQRPDGWFEARYVPGTTEPPDDRSQQFDGTGLVLWAAAEVVGAGARPPDAEVTERLAPLVTTSTDLLLRTTRDGQRMPPISPDYWEVSEHTVTLGIMACTLSGLRGAAVLHGTRRTAQAADAFTALLTSTFGPLGYQRYRRSGGADSARAFLDATGCHGIIEPRLLTSLRAELARPGGGIAPGASWREDGISWTPSTSLLTLALARAGRRVEARELLSWIAAHRTAAGSLPEKVLFDGRPAAVAPLAWTAANVLLAIDALAP